MDIVDAVESAAGSEEYINNAARKVASAVRAGKKYPDAAPHDNQLHALVKLPIVVARYVGAAPLASRPPMLHGPPCITLRSACSTTRCCSCVRAVSESESSRRLLLLWHRDRCSPRRSDGVAVLHVTARAASRFCAVSVSRVS